MHGLAEAQGVWNAGKIAGADLVQRLIDELTDDSISVPDRARALEIISLQSQNSGQMAVWVEALLKLSTPCGVNGTWKGKPLFDCAGTGGMGLSTINVSTAAVFLLAPMGVVTVKHGTIGVTRKSGSADLMKNLGLSVEVTPEDVPVYLEELGAVFLFAPHFHPVFRKMVPVRQHLATEGKKSLFNQLGPVVNPANPSRQVVGVTNRADLDLYAGLFNQVQKERFLVVWGQDARSGGFLGEVSVTGENDFRSNFGKEEMPPAQWPIGRSTRALEEMLVTSGEESARRIEAILLNEDRGLCREVVLANAAACTCVYEPCSDYAAAREKAQEILDSGAAHALLQKWRKLSQQLKN